MKQTQRNLTFGAKAEVAICEDPGMALERSVGQKSFGTFLVLTGSPAPFELVGDVSHGTTRSSSEGIRMRSAE